MKKLITPINEIVDFSKVATYETPKYEGEIFKLAEKENLKSACLVPKKKLLILIDEQNDFMEGIGSLGVPGSKADTQRLIQFIYDHMEDISQIRCSMDTHTYRRISHPCWFKDKNGNFPEVNTPMTYEMIQNGWTPQYYPKETIEYIKGVEAAGALSMIWEYHCLEGSRGANLEAQLYNMIMFHSVVRNSVPEFIQKGYDPLTEMYGILKAEYDPRNIVNTAFLSDLEKYDEIYITGQAKSHCAIRSLEQILEELEQNSQNTGKVIFIEDCSSSIPGFEKETEARFEAVKKRYGIKVLKTTEIN